MEVFEYNDRAQYLYDKNDFELRLNSNNYIKSIANACIIFIFFQLFQKVLRILDFYLLKVLTRSNLLWEIFRAFLLKNYF